MLVAKLFKIAERIGTQRMQVKDAVDVFRLLRGIQTTEFVSRIEVVLASELSAQVADEALRHLASLFGKEDSPGTRAVAEAFQVIDDPAVMSASCAALASDLVDALGIR